MKTIEQWLKTLPEPLRSEAINNSSKGALKKKVSSLRSAVCVGFIWTESDSGTEFWWSFYVALREAERDQQN